jgi:hypothetical protein
MKQEAGVHKRLFLVAAFWAAGSASSPASSIVEYGTDAARTPSIIRAEGAGGSRSILPVEVGRSGDHPSIVTFAVPPVSDEKVSAIAKDRRRPPPMPTIIRGGTAEPVHGHGSVAHAPSSKAGAAPANIAVMPKAPPIVPM